MACYDLLARGELTLAFTFKAMVQIKPPY